MKIDTNEITFQAGWEDEDFVNFKHTIVAKYKNLTVKFKISDEIRNGLKYRLIIYKAKKRIYKAMQIFPLGGYIKYSLP